MAPGSASDAAERGRLTDTHGAVWAAPIPRVVPAVLGARPAAREEAVVERVDESPPGHGQFTAPPRQSPAQRPVVAFFSRPLFGVTVGQIVSWQVSLTLIGVAVGRPLPVAVPAVACAAVLLTMTVLRVRERWLYQWVSHYARYRRRERGRYLPREDGPRAVLHLFAPDAMLGSIQVDDGETAVVNRTSGATAVLRPLPSDTDPVMTLPRPATLLGAGVAVQVVFLGIANGRRMPMAWLAVQAIRTAKLSEEDELVLVLGAAARRVLGELTERGVRGAGVDRTELLRTVTSLAHIGEDRRDVRERWRTWRCGRVVQAVFRLRGWATLPDDAARQLLVRLLTTSTDAVVTVTVAAGSPGPEVATMRVAASAAENLERAVKQLGAMATEQAVRLDRLNGEQADGVAAVLPLGVDREGSQ